MRIAGGIKIVRGVWVFSGVEWRGDDERMVGFTDNRTSHLTICAVQSGLRSYVLHYT